MLGGSPIKDYAVIPQRKGWETWHLNNIHPTVACDRWFNLHHFKTLKSEWAHGLSAEIAWAHLNPEVPCYVLESWCGVIPNERIFPRAKLARMPRGNYHCGSFDWMVAYAVLLGAREISMHGIGLAMESGEPSSAWACLEYWIGYAQGRGINVNCVDCNIFYNYRLVRDHKAYGYDDWDLIEDRT